MDEDEGPVGVAMPDVGCTAPAAGPNVDCTAVAVVMIRLPSRDC